MNGPKSKNPNAPRKELLLNPPNSKIQAKSLDLGVWILELGMVGLGFAFWIGEFGIVDFGS